MKSLSRNILLTFVVTSFAFLPTFASADSKNGLEKKREKIEQKMEQKIEKMNQKLEKVEEKAEEKIEKRMSKYSQKCWNTLFQRFLPFSWMKLNWDNIDLDQNCSRFYSTPSNAVISDTVAPVISDIASKTGNNRALIIWKTDEKTTGKVYYSTSTPVDITKSPVVASGKWNTGGREHYVLIGGLASSTTYRFIIEAKDKAGNVSRSGENTFTTKSTTVSSDVTAPIISSVSFVVGTSTVNVNWNTNESATSKVYYSSSTPVNTLSANFVQNSAFTIGHSLKIENLSTSTAYYFIVESVDTAANVATSTQFATTTLSQ